MDKPHLPAPVMFHAEIMVEKDGIVHHVKIDRPAWEPEDVLVKQIVSETNSKTVGEALTKLKVVLGSGTDTRKVTPYQPGNRDIWKWDQQV